jgi:hypothetical protein
MHGASHAVRRVLMLLFDPNYGVLPCDKTGHFGSGQSTATETRPPLGAWAGGKGRGKKKKQLGMFTAPDRQQAGQAGWQTRPGWWSRAKLMNET